VAAAAALLAVGCGPVMKVNRMADAESLMLPYKNPGCGIPIVRRVMPEERFAIIARLSLSDPNGYLALDRNRSESRLIDEACQLGADAVLIEREQYAVPYTGTDVVALAISYAHEPAAAPPAKTQARPEPPPRREAFGTCFAINGEGRLVTAEHVIRDARRISVQFEGSEPVDAAVLARDEETDVAILSVDAPTPDFLPLASADHATSGDRVFTFGFPVMDLLGQEPKFTDGAVSSLSGLQGEKRLMQVTVPIQPGNSGGPIVTETGLAIGVITSTAAAVAFFEATGSQPQGINWAVKADHAIELLDEPLETPKEVKRKAAVKRARKSVCAVIVRTQKRKKDSKD
jgi:S1-C subfamily serine protease